MNKNDNENIKPIKSQKRTDPSLGNFVSGYTEDSHAKQKAADYLRSRMRDLHHERAINNFQPIGCLNILLIYIC